MEKKDARLTRIEALKRAMKEKAVDAYILPMRDDHGSEYIGDYFKQIRYFSGFTGSAGTLLVTQEGSFLWTDGRYFLQAGQQLEGSGIALQKAGEPGVPTLTEFLKAGYHQGTFGFDGKLVSASFVKQLEEIGCCLDEDLSGPIWDNDREEERPSFPGEPIWILEEKYAGMSVRKKLSLIREDLRKERADYLVLTALDDIAWLTNLRGNDIAYNPVFMAYMVLSEEKAVLYTNHQDDTTEAYLKDNGIEKKGYGCFFEDVKKLLPEKKVWVSENASYQTITSIPQSCLKITKTNPVVFWKAVKNNIETENIRQAHIKDGVAVTKFLFWLKSQVATGKTTATELEAAQKLIRLRRQQEGYLGESFEPIMAFAGHGAVVHYSADEDSDAVLKGESFLLSDTGGHYLQGTTDITRTVAMGALTGEQKCHYTAVLQGNLRLMDACFKKGLGGANLDYLAREPLYRLGLDYNHGTGHGVGYLLNVHEGPNGFRMKADPDNVLKAGMVTSDEPGVYLQGRYGIRLENMILCVKREETEFGEFLGFEPLTMVPFDRDAVDEEMLSVRDREVLNAYHKKVFETLESYLEEEELNWLREVTKEI